MAMVKFYRIDTASNLPIASAETEGAMYFVEDTQSFYRGSAVTKNETTTYSLAPVKVLINGADATLSDADILKVRKNDDTLAAVSQSKLDKPMDTEALYKTFGTRNKLFKTYVVPSNQFVKQTYYIRSSYDGDEASSTHGTYTESVSLIDPDATLASEALNAYKDGKTIVLIPIETLAYKNYGSDYIFVDTSAREVNLVDKDMDSFGYQKPNPLYSATNHYQKFIYLIDEERRELIGDPYVDTTPVWDYEWYSVWHSEV